MRLTLMIRAAAARDIPCLTRHRNRARFGVSCSLRSVLLTYAIIYSCDYILGAVESLGELYKLRVLRREKVLEQRDAKFTALQGGCS